MSTVQFELPDAFPYSTRLQVHMAYINYGAHVGSDGYLTIVNEARVRYLRYYGMKEFDAEGMSLVITESYLKYLGESFPGDELEIHVAAKDFSRVGFDIYYKFFNLTTGKEVLIAKNGIVCIDPQLKKIAKIPASLKEKLTL